MRRMLLVHHLVRATNEYHCQMLARIRLETKGLIQTSTLLIFDRLVADFTTAIIQVTIIQTINKSENNKTKQSM